MRKHLILTLALCFAAALASAQTLSTTLSGTAEVPGPGDTDGTGFAVVTVNGTTINWVILVSKIAAPTQAHIHRGTSAVSGPVVVNFNPTFTGGAASGSVAGVDQALINEILGNPSGFYVNVHNGDFPNGAIRGQLTGAGTGEGARTLIVPVVGKVAGAAGTNFITDLRIINQGTATANVTLDFFQQNGAGQTAPTATLATTVAPGEQKVMDDVIAALSTSGLGGLRVTSNQDVIVTSRVINDLRAAGQGTNGFAIDATPLAGAGTAATISFLSQASTADINTGVGFRTNIGYFNPSSSQVTATFTARRSSDGVVLGSRTITIPGFSFVQQGAFSLINTVAAADQVQANFYVTWTSTGPLFVYGAVTDNKTGDAVLIQ